MRKTTAYYVNLYDEHDDNPFTNLELRWQISILNFVYIFDRIIYLVIIYMLRNTGVMIIWRERPSLQNSTHNPWVVFAMSECTGCSLNIVFFLKILDFSELCQFWCSAGFLPALCVYTEGEERKTRDRNILKFSEKHNPL